jgi:hypothetical protein
MPELGTPTLSYIREFFKAKLFANIADEARYKISRCCSSECQGELLEGMNEGRCLREQKVDGTRGNVRRALLEGTKSGCFKRKM